MVMMVYDGYVIITSIYFYSKYEIGLQNTLLGLTVLVK